jgi:hypothetical protein
VSKGATEKEWSQLSLLRIVLAKHDKSEDEERI